MLSAFRSLLYHRNIVSILNRIISAASILIYSIYCHAQVLFLRVDFIQLDSNVDNK